MESLLFQPLQIRELNIKNRIAVSPMCQYSAEEGVPNNWHLVHLGSRAAGGAGIVICEATSVSPEGRISPGDTGIWNEKQIEAFKPITEFIKSQDSIPAIQIAHAGRKASTHRPWQGYGAVPLDQGGWVPMAPSPIRYSEKYHEPKEMSPADLRMVLEQFAQAAHNALKAGFEIAEIHMAHGYLLSEFLSPLSNQRNDEYGGSIENRMRFPLAVAQEIRKIWPAKWPVFVRISATDWVEGGWTLEDSIIFARRLKQIGIDLIDCSSGGVSPQQKITTGPNYQVHLSKGVRKEAGILTGAVGMITQPKQAEAILKNEEADFIFMARELLRHPYWPLHAAKKLNVKIAWPKQYERAQE